MYRDRALILEQELARAAVREQELHTDKQSVSQLQWRVAVLEVRVHVCIVCVCVCV